MYLVILRHSMDDVPLYLSDQWDKAVDYAKAAGWQPPTEIDVALGLPDMRTPEMIQVIEFRGAKPHKVVFERLYDDEDGDDGDEPAPEPLPVGDQQTV